jgi:hypothetical protein
MAAWGNRHFAPDGAHVIVVDAETGEQADPVLIDRNSGKVMTPDRFRSAPGPAADDQTRRRLQRAANRQPESAS